MSKEEKKKKKELKHWNQEVKLIPKMIEIYCHGNHHTKKHEFCKECEELKEYSLFRLSKCPFKVNKKFCSFCKIHCYKPEMKLKIKEVMRYSGPRMIFHHPAAAIRHVILTKKEKKQIESKG